MKDPKGELRREPKEESPKEPKEHRRKRNDWLLIGGILLLAGVVFLLVRFVFTKEGTKAVITLNGTVILEQELTQDCRIPIQTEQGYNIFQVEDGVAVITEADCRDQICVNHIAISKKGESIICLPHKLVVEIQ